MGGCYIKPLVGSTSIYGCIFLATVFLDQSSTWWNSCLHASMNLLALYNIETKYIFLETGAQAGGDGLHMHATRDNPKSRTETKYKRNWTEKHPTRVKRKITEISQKNCFSEMLRLRSLCHVAKYASPWPFGRKQAPAWNRLTCCEYFCGLVAANSRWRNPANRRMR